MRVCVCEREREGVCVCVGNYLVIKVTIFPETLKNFPRLSIAFLLNELNHGHHHPGSLTHAYVFKIITMVIVFNSKIQSTVIIKESIQNSHNMKSDDRCNRIL